MVESVRGIVYRDFFSCTAYENPSSTKYYFKKYLLEIRAFELVSYGVNANIPHAFHHSFECKSCRFRFYIDFNGNVFQWENDS